MTSIDVTQKSTCRCGKIARMQEKSRLTYRQAIVTHRITIWYGYFGPLVCLYITIVEP